MRRERLKSTTGCTTCRSKKKKCDEKRPRCSLCERLQSRCLYVASKSAGNLQRKHEAHDIRMPHCESTPSPANPSLAYRALAADFTLESNQTPSITRCDSDDTLRLGANRHRRANIKTLFKPEILQDIVISGVLDGWQEAYIKYGVGSLVDLAYWKLLPYGDAHLKAAGQGQAARIIFAWYFLLLSQVS